MHITLTVPQVISFLSSGYLMTAIVSTMPPKGTVWSAEVFYDWFFDCAHMLLNQRHPM